MRQFVQVFRSGRASFGLSLSLAGVCILLVTLYNGVTFLFLDERLLLFLPALAKSVTIEELLSNPEKYHENWIRIRGELWGKTQKEAWLISIGSNGKTNEVYPRVEDPERGVPRSPPEKSLFLHNFSSQGLRTFSPIEIKPEQAVEIVGEFEYHSTRYGPHIDVVATIDPRQDELRSPATRKLALFAALLVASGFLVYLGWVIGRSAIDRSADAL